jgi:hypothetical protein
MRAPILGFSLALPSQLRGVREAVERVMQTAAPHPRFVVGGFPVRCGMRAHPELPIDMLADPMDLIRSLEHSGIAGTEDKVEQQSTTCAKSPARSTKKS